MARPPDTRGLPEALRRGDVAVRGAAAARLAGVGDAGAMADPVRALHDPDGDVRARAQAAVRATRHRSGDSEVDALPRAGISRRRAGGAPPRPWPRGAR